MLFLNSCIIKIRQTWGQINAHFFSRLGNCSIQEVLKLSFNSLRKTTVTRRPVGGEDFISPAFNTKEKLPCRLCFISMEIFSNKRLVKLT